MWNFSSSLRTIAKHCGLPNFHVNVTSSEGSFSSSFPPRCLLLIFLAWLHRIKTPEPCWKDVVRTSTLVLFLILRDCIHIPSVCVSHSEQIHTLLPLPYQWQIFLVKSNAFSVLLSLSYVVWLFLFQFIVWNHIISDVKPTQNSWN